MRIIFAGTPTFAVSSLLALINAGHTIAAVYTQPDRPAGRGRQLTASAVKVAALAHAIPVMQPTTLRDETVQQALRAWQADLMVVVAYGLLLPLPVLHIPRLGCINVHASLLPRFRGAAPIQRALLAGDTETGVTLMQMDEGLDTGAMLSHVRCPILPNDTAGTLHDRLASLGADALVALLQQPANAWVACPQDATQASYAQKISRAEARIDWCCDAVTIERQVRAFQPTPVTFTSLAGNTVRIWQANVLETSGIHGQPGEIIQVNAAGFAVATGCGVLQIQMMQLPGGKVLPVSAILHARRQTFFVGAVFDQ